MCVYPKRGIGREGEKRGGRREREGEEGREGERGEGGGKRRIKGGVGERGRTRKEK